MAVRAQFWNKAIEGSKAIEVEAPVALTPEASDLAPQSEQEHGLQALFEFDPASRLISWSDVSVASRILGAWVAERPTDIDDYEARITDGAIETRTQALATTADSYSCEYKVANGDNGVWVEERGGWISVSGQKRLIGVIRSVENERNHRKRLLRLAVIDELTGVFNRPRLRQKLEDALSAMTAANTTGAYLLAGIDDLGGINADFGFEVADDVIREIAKRLSAVLSEGDSIGRVAGTKFGIVIAETNETKLRETCIRLMNTIRENVIDTSKGAVTASICLGSVELPDNVGANVVMARAEAALDQAKRKGRSSWATFDEKTDTISLRRRNTHMSDVILTALNERRIRLAFQPIVSDIGETPMKHECLIRMHNEEGQNIGAPEFIPVAERLGLVHLLDRRVLELAINTLAQTPNVRLNVNVSMETVKDPVWAEGYLSLLRAHEPLARRITVELTETQVIDAIEASIEFVSEIKSLGASFAIDDFGAGYTSFRNLKALDIDILKIDGSFVTGVASSRENQLFVRTLLDLARNFGMKTVAEWVDNEADAMLLKGLGVDYLQGFLLGRPETNPVWLPGGAPNEPPKNPLRS